MSDTETCLTNLTFGQGIGLLLVVQAGLLSMFADTLAFVLIVRNFLRLPPHTRSVSSLLNHTLHALILSIIFSDFIQGLAASLNLRWIVQQRVYCSDFCTWQGALSTLGGTTSAMATLAIAVYTFVTIAFSLRIVNPWVPKIIVGSIWSYVGLFVAIETGRRRSSSTATSGGAVTNFMIPAPYWCWIGGNYTADRIVGEYLWIWLAATASLFLYIPLFFIVRYLLRRPRSTYAESINEDGTAKLEYKFLAYPIAFTVFVFPLSVVRWVSFGGRSVPNQATFATAVFFYLTGVMNVFLFLYLRSATLLFGEDERVATGFVGTFPGELKTIEIEEFPRVEGEGALPD